MGCVLPLRFKMSDTSLNAMASLEALMFELTFFEQDVIVMFNIEYLTTMFTDFIMLGEDKMLFLEECKGRNIPRQEAKELLCVYNEFQEWKGKRQAKVLLGLPF